MIAAVLGFIASWAVKLGGSALVDKLVGLARERFATAVDRDKIAADVAIKTLETQAAVAAKVEERRQIEAGHWTGRLILLLVMVPPAVYLAGIYWVSLFPALGWRIERLPAWQETMLIPLITGWVGVHGAGAVARSWRQ